MNTARPIQPERKILCGKGAVAPAPHKPRGLGRFLAASLMLHAAAALGLAGWSMTHSHAQLHVQSGRGGMRLDWVPFSSKAVGPDLAPAHPETSPAPVRTPEPKQTTVQPDSLLAVAQAHRAAASAAAPMKPASQARPHPSQQPASAGGSDSAGAATEARPAHCPAPPYPTAARLAGKEGTVRLRLIILENGRVAQAQIVESSGRRDLDEAAQRTILKQWKYHPAERAGLAVSVVEIVRVEFKLENS